MDGLSMREGGLAGGLANFQRELPGLEQVVRGDCICPSCSLLFRDDMRKYSWVAAPTMLRWRDVWAYIFSKNLPYASVYDTYAPVVGLENCRLVTFFDPEFDKFGSGNVDSALMWRFRHV